MISVSIQAGGRSKRMGENKALMNFLGAPLIQRVAERIKPVADEMNIITAEPALFDFLGIPIFPDRYPGCGVLGGILTALSVTNLEFVAPIGCDMPFISPVLLAAEIATMEATGADVVIPKTQRGVEPLHAVYRSYACLPAVENAVFSGERRIISWFQNVNVVVLTEPELFRIDPSPYSFMNLNTPEEFQQAESIARGL